MAEAKSREQLEKEWWDAWWAADYSWEGLAKHKISGEGGLFGEKTLQDYWRRDPETGAVRDDAAMRAAGEIVEIDGTMFHIAHLPATLKYGAASSKADLKHPVWANLDLLLAARLAAAAETTIDWKGDVEGRDARAQVVGTVLRGAFAHPHGIEHPLIVHCRSALFLGVVNWRNALFGAGASFQRATFLGDAMFDSAMFSGSAWFQSATFSGDAGFYGTTFSGRAGFQSATFVGDAWFESVAFRAAAGFTSASFLAAALFSSAAISGVANFSGATFAGDANFLRARFSDFATFEGGKGEEKGQVRFDDATFAGGADFRNWLFDGLVYFDGAHFRGDMDFSTAVFGKVGSFERILWPDDARHWHSAFDQTLFRGTASFTGAGFMRYAAFDGATFERGVQIDDATERASKQQFLMEKAAAIAAAKADGAAFEAEANEKRKEKGERVSRAEVAGKVRRQREERLKQLERGCRVLKQAMEKASNKSREQLLYRFELQARRAQKGLPPGEALFSDLYGATSDYGASMVRPFVTLALLIGVFTAVFFLTGSALGLVGAGEGQVGGLAAWLQAFDLSWANVFKPLSALTADGTPEGSLGAKLLGHSPVVGSLLRVAATLQSLLAIVLAFLFALAVRRRFQIS